MASLHIALVTGSPLPSPFLGSFERRTCLELCSGSPIDWSGVWRRKATGFRRSCSPMQRSEGYLNSSLRSSYGVRNYVPQPVRKGVLDRSRESLGSRNWEVRAEPQESVKGEKGDYKVYNALMRGGSAVTEMLKEMAELLEDIAGLNNEEEEAALRMAAAGVVGQKIDRLEGNFMMALDYMMDQTEKEKDDQKKRVLEVIRETVMAQLSQKFPSQVQVVSALCVTPCKDARQEILRRCAGGGGTFKTERGDDITLPGANLNDVANQADDIISTMEEKPLLPDRKLLAKLVLVREEARSLLGGGILDERNDNKGFKNLPEPEIAFISKLVALKPGPPVRERLAKVMRGKDEGKEKPAEDLESQPTSRRRLVNVGKGASVKEAKVNGDALRPVRPGIFLETLTKLLAGMYESKTAVGVTVQQLEWIHRVTMDILQEMAY
ncbi:unnamed protein product [Calypogeia fissa]